MKILFLLLVAHALCDYPWQGDFLSKGKNHKDAVPGVPWYHCLFAHALIHAGAVYFITGALWVASAELVIHALIDYAKCAGWFGEGPDSRAYSIDQFIHYACKILWAILIWRTA